MKNSKRIFSSNRHITYSGTVAFWIYYTISRVIIVLKLLHIVEEFEIRFSLQLAHSCKYHVIFCPKYRRKVLINNVDKRLKEIILEIIQETKSSLLEMEILPDHVHLLVETDPQFGIHKLIKRIKGRSSRLLRNEFSFLRKKLPTLWTHSYFLATVGGAPLKVIKKYIEDQKHV